MTKWNAECGGRSLVKEFIGALGEWKSTCAAGLETVQGGGGRDKDFLAASSWPRWQDGYGTGADLPAGQADFGCIWEVRCCRTIGWYGEEGVEHTEQRNACNETRPEWRAWCSKCESEEMPQSIVERQQRRCQQRDGGYRTSGCAAESRTAEKCCSGVGVGWRRGVYTLTHRAISDGWRAPVSCPWLKQQPKQQSSNTTAGDGCGAISPTSDPRRGRAELHV